MRIVFILVCIWCLASCKKDNCSFSGDDQNNYTQRDVNGDIVGTVDTKDWTTDLRWNTCETNLFSIPDTITYQNLTASRFSNIVAFPNPFKPTLIFHGEDTGFMVIKLVLVDEKMNVISHNIFTTYGGTTISLSPQALKENGSYRLYYQALGENKTILCQGHGDLRVL